MFEKMLKLAGLSLLSVLASCSSEKVSGGTSEETNAIAGVMLDGSGKALAGVVVEVRSVSQVPTAALSKTAADSANRVHLDTTGSDGRWAVALSEYGDYGVVGHHDSLLGYQVVNYSGKLVEISDTLRTGAPLSGSVAMTGDSVRTPVRVGLPGTPWAVWSDSLGQFRFASLPAGDYSFVVYSPDPERFVSTSYYVSWRPGVDSKVLGPLPVASVPDSGWNTAMSAAAYSSSFQWELPMNPEYGLQGWWTLDYYRNVDLGQEIADARGRSGTAMVNSDTLNVAGYKGAALAFRSSRDWAVIEDDRDVLAGARTLTVEAWIYLAEVPTVSDAPRNLFGKLTTGPEEGQSLFSLAVVRGACATDGPVFAFFLTAGSGEGLNCNSAVLATTAAPLGTWVHLAAVWDGVTLALYQNGELAGSKAHVMPEIAVDNVPVYFGKSDLNFRIDEVRWGTQALRAPDVLYRYRMFDQSEWVP